MSAPRASSTTFRRIGTATGLTAASAVGYLERCIAVISKRGGTFTHVRPEGFPTAGAYRGSAEVQEHVRTGRGTWAEGSCDPEKFLIKGEKVVVYLHARVRLKDATEWIGGRFADGFVFRNGKITEYHTFGERVQALEWAGIHDE